MKLANLTAKYTKFSEVFLGKFKLLLEELN